MRGRELAIVLALVTFSPGIARAQVAGSVEDGLAGLAKQIVQKSVAADRNTIAVLPFPNADGSCSVLSTYIVDELILSLFSVPDSKLEIVERAQLEALLDEIQLGEGGLLNPETTKKLGTQSGVSALTVGTITVIGDTIRLNARLVATDTGKTISAAAVTVPKTQAVTDLLEQPVTTGATCGPQAGSSKQARAGGDPQSSTRSATSNRINVPTPNPNLTESEFEAEGIRFFVQSLSRSNDKKAVNLTISLLNTSDKPLRVAWIKPVPSILDDSGNILKLISISGQQSCSSSRSRQFDLDGRLCFKNYSDYFSTISAGKIATVNLRFGNIDDGMNEVIEGTSISFAGNLYLVSQSSDDKELKVQQQSVSISIPNISFQETIKVK